jgi:hypothetical protein
LSTDCSETVWSEEEAAGELLGLLGTTALGVVMELELGTTEEEGGFVVAKVVGVVEAMREVDVMVVSAAVVLAAPVVVVVVVVVVVIAPEPVPSLGPL